MTRREFLQSSAPCAAAATICGADPNLPADYSIDIAPFTLEASPRHNIATIAYNGQVPGPLLRLREAKPVVIDVANHTRNREVVHWHGLFLPSEIDGAMEEGTPEIPSGATARYTFAPQPAGFRWYHTHTFAGRDLKKGQYTGQHGFLYVEPRTSPGRHDAEFFLALHDWRGQLLASEDGSMNPEYDVSTINGRALGFGEPLRVKAGQRIVLHILNSSPTEIHWVALPGHQFEVLALDGNPVPKSVSVPMLRLAPAERISASVLMNNPGIWILGEIRKHIQSSGMGIVIEYADQRGKPVWQQPATLAWDYLSFTSAQAASPTSGAIEIPLVFKSKFTGHGDLDHWTINGKSYPHTETVALRNGQRYRLLFKNESADPHPVHLHRHIFELRKLPGAPETSGIFKDTVLVEANTQLDVEFIARNPGPTLFHCHQQDHMDAGFMMLFNYA